MRTNRKLIIDANRYGLAEHKRDNDEWTSWYTPVLQIAYEYGRRGIDLSDCDDVSGYRYGNIPDGGLSINHRDHESERGLSLAAIDGCEENWIVIFLLERPKIKVSGLLLPKTGAEGEPLILAYGLEQYDYQIMAIMDWAATEQGKKYDGYLGNIHPCVIDGFIRSVILKKN